MKKCFLPFLLLAIFSLSPTLTRAGDPDPKGAGFIGKITATSAEDKKMTLTTESGETMVVLIGDETVIVSKSGDPMTISDLTAERTVRITGGGKESAAAKIEVMD